jgi:hypothetical protein
MFGTFEVDSLHQPFIRVGIVARQRWPPWESLAVSRGWTVVWVAEDSPTELTSTRVSFDFLSLHFFIRSQFSIILTDGRLPGPTSFWWHSTSPLLLDIGIRMPKKRSYYTYPGSSTGGIVNITKIGKAEGTREPGYMQPMQLLSNAHVQWILSISSKKAYQKIG